MSDHLSQRRLYRFLLVNAARVADREAAVVDEILTGPLRTYSLEHYHCRQPIHACLFCGVGANMNVQVYHYSQV